jgi:hypothetical protein
MNKFYRVIVPFLNKPITPELTQLDNSFRGIPTVRGDTVKNGKKMIPRIGESGFDTSSLPIFDYFHLETLDKNRKSWEWCKNDVHDIDGEYSPSTFSLFISQQVKDILAKYSIAKPSGFVPAKLQYRGEKFDSYIFYSFRYCRFDEIVFEESSFQLCNNSSRKFIGDYEGKIADYESYLLVEKHIRHNLGHDIFFKKVTLRKYYDFLMLVNDRFFYVSERLKKDLEENGITGIEFVEATDMEFHFLETPPLIK